MNKSQVRRTSTADSEADSPKHILVVDDEESILELIAAYLTKHGYRVATATTGAAALRVANKQPVHLIVLDVLLGDEDGIELLEKFKAARPTRPVIIMTGLGFDDDLMRTAAEKGATAFISKTAPLDQLLRTVEGALNPQNVEALEAADAEARAPAELSESEEPAPSTEPVPAAAAPAQTGETILVASQMAIIPEGERFDFGMEVFVRMLSAYHPNLGNTATRAVAVCSALGKILDLPANQCRNLLWAAALHDVALVRIDRGIVGRWMRDPGKCSKPEMALIRRHPAQSQEMLEFCPVFKEAGEIIRAHHENWDGTGYPDGLKMEMIPWLARLLAVVLDYCGRNLPDSHTVKDIKAQADTTYDPQAVEAVLKTLPQVTLPRGGREMMSHELKPGMVLAADIVNLDGMLVLGKAKELTAASLNKIVQYSRAGQIDPHVLVYC